LENPRIEPLDPQHPAATPKDTTVVSFFRTSRKRSQK